jgi:ubiquinone/menaquinone biosynthesis C-methylase UbiE
MDPAAREAERIKEEYRRRDAAAMAGGSPWLDPIYRLQLQELESALLAAIAAAGVPLAGARALEVGCGSGYYLNRLLDYGAATGAGIDLVEDRIATARERYPRLELVAGDASALPWPDASFGLVTQFTCLSSVLDRDVRAAIAAEMWRVVAPGGAIVSSDIRPPHGPLRAYRRLGGLLARSRSLPPGAAAEPVELAELRAWWPASELSQRSVGLDPELARLFARVRLPARLAALIPPLRTHTLAVARKPG